MRQVELFHLIHKGEIMDYELFYEITNRWDDIIGRWEGDHWDQFEVISELIHSDADLSDLMNDFITMIKMFEDEFEL